MEVGRADPPEYRNGGDEDERQVSDEDEKKENSLRVLIVDDEAVARRMMSRLLRYRYDVLYAPATCLCCLGCASISVQILLPFAYHHPRDRCGLIHEAADGAEAIRMVLAAEDRRQKPYDMIMMNNKMPHMDGPTGTYCMYVCIRIWMYVCRLCVVSCD